MTRHVTRNYAQQLVANIASCYKKYLFRSLHNTIVNKLKSFIDYFHLFFYLCTLEKVRIQVVFREFTTMMRIFDTIFVHMCLCVRSRQPIKHTFNPISFAARCFFSLVPMKTKWSRVFFPVILSYSIGIVQGSNAHILKAYIHTCMIRPTNKTQSSIA